MKKYELPMETLQELKVAHRTSKQVSAYSAYPIHTIILLNEDTVRTYFDKYVSGGLVKLLETSYQDSNKKLTKDQIKQLQEELDRHVHLTTKTVCRFVHLEFDME